MQAVTLVSMSGMSTLPVWTTDPSSLLLTEEHCDVLPD